MPYHSLRSDRTELGINKVESGACGEGDSPRIKARECPYDQKVVPQAGLANIEDRKARGCDKPVAVNRDRG